MLVSKKEKTSNNKINSAYITFETNEQAACCILAIDSIKINNNIVRAFFGTTKYCNHFLNNYHCFNEEKCMFMHYLAEPSDIIDENTKFGYNDHIKLAKKIIGYGTLQGKYYISKNISQKKAILPNINTIYEKEKGKVTINNKNYRRQLSNLSNNSTSNNSSNRSNDNNLSQSSSKEKDNNTSNDNIDLNHNQFECFKSANKSRFFNKTNDDIHIYNNIYESKNLMYIVNNLCKRMPFFNFLKNNYKNGQFLRELEKDYCFNIYRETNDNEIKLLLENKF